MSTVQAFNSLLKTFVDDLARTNPANEQLTAFVTNFDTVVMLDEKKPMAMFMAAVGPKSDAIMAKDGAAFAGLNLGGIDLEALWASLSEANRAHVWEYLHMLVLLAKAVSSIPPALLQTIEGVASSAAASMQNGEVDFSGVMKMVMNMMGGSSLLAPNL